MGIVIMTTSPIHIEAQQIYAGEPLGIQTLEHLLNAWLSVKDTFVINHENFNDVCKYFELQKVNSYHDTRAKRFQKVIEERLLAPMFENISLNVPGQKQITVKLCQWLIKNAVNDKWLQVLQRRLTDALFNVSLKIERQIEVTTKTPGSIELQMKFQTYTIDSNLPQLIFEGESFFLFQIDAKANISTKLIAKADLFDDSMHQAFITPPLDEQVNQYIHQTKLDLHEEEIEILQSARNYYLNKTTAQELQQHFISTNIYSTEFKNSKGYELLKDIFAEKPIKGLNL